MRGARTSSMRPWMRFAILCLIAFALAPAGCKDDVPKPPPVVELSPVPAPAGHVADIVIPKPAETFANLRTRVGGALTLLPGTFPSAVVTMLGLTPQLIEQVDGASPAYGVITDDGKRTVVVMGFHVLDGARTASLLTEGADAKYTLAKDASGVVILDPKPTLTSRAAALGIVGHYLLTAEKREDLIAAGRYVGSTLPKRPAENGEIVITAPKAALAGPIEKRVRETWDSFRKEREKEAAEMKEKKGRDADFASPAAALGDIDGKVNRLVAVLSDVDVARLQIDTDDNGVHARLTATPSTGGGVASQELEAMVTGDTTPALALPKQTVFGLMVRDNAKLREENAKQQTDGLAGLLGERINEAEKAKLLKALTAWASGRGDWLTAAVAVEGSEQEAVVRGTVTDPKPLDESIRALMSLLSIPAFREPIEAHLGKVTADKPKKVGDAIVAHMKRESADSEGKKGRTSEFDVAWKIAEGDAGFELRVVSDAARWLQPKEPAEGGTLADHADVAAVLRGMGSDVSFVLYVEPRLLLSSMAPKGAKTKPGRSPMLLSYGGAKNQGWLRLDLSHEAARELIKMSASRRPR